MDARNIGNTMQELELADSFEASDSKGLWVKDPERHLLMHRARTLVATVEGLDRQLARAAETLNLPVLRELLELAKQVPLGAAGCSCWTAIRLLGASRTICRVNACVRHRRLLCADGL